MQNLSEATRQVIGGSALLVVCMIFYLIWWWITFKPGGGATAFGTVCIVAAALAGLTGVVVSAIGYSEYPVPAEAIPNSSIVVAGLILYVVLLFVTYLLLKRPVTTELFLIIGFLVLELSLLNAASGAGAISHTAAVILAIMLMVVVIASMVCYLLYYNLDGTTGWIDGMIPLVISALYEIVLISTVLAGAASSAA